MTKPSETDEERSLRFESMTDEEWASSLSARIAGQTGETWTRVGIERAIVVAMRRAYDRGVAAGIRRCIEGGS